MERKGDSMVEEILSKMINQIDKTKFSNNKICISFVGGPGFGKSTIAKKLCEKLNMFHCSNDYIARELEKIDVDITDYEQKTKLVSSIAFPFQDFLFENNIDFVLDANLMLYLDVLRKRCENYNYHLYIIEIDINHEEALRRSLKRLKENNPENLSNSDLEDFKLFEKQYKEYKLRENKDYIFAKINMEQDNLDEQIDNLIKKIKEDIK